MDKSLLKILTSLFLTVSILGCTASESDKRQSTGSVVSDDGSSIAYGVSGQGDLTLVFIHCWTCDHGFWDAQIAHFKNAHQAVWVDLAGHGESNSHRTDYTMAAFGGDVAAVVNQLGAEKVVLIGHSMGGPVAVEAAKQLGDKVVGVVGVDTFYTDFEFPKSEVKIDEFITPFKQDFKNATEQMIRSMFTPNAAPEIVEQMVRYFAGADREMGISAMYEIFRWNMENNPEALNRLGEKLKNINGAPGGDKVAGHESVVLIPGVGHFVAQVKPQAFNDALVTIIDGFLAGKSSAGG
jgi:pimeloyl-ACP methyl ester carboxylesterase